MAGMRRAGRGLHAGRIIIHFNFCFRSPLLQLRNNDVVVDIAYRRVELPGKSCIPRPRRRGSVRRGQQKHGEPEEGHVMLGMA